MLGSPSLGKIFWFLRAVSVVTFMRTEGESLCARVSETGNATGKGDAMMSCANCLRVGSAALSLLCCTGSLTW